MNVEINGEPCELPAGACVADAVTLLGVGAASGCRGVAVALDGEVVRRGAWPDTPLEAGSRVEVLAAIAGG